MDRQPTENQKKVFRQVAENVRKGQKISVSKAMVESGVYSESYSRKPTKLTKSKGWKKLLDEFLSEQELSQKHFELLNATTLDHMVFPLGCRFISEKEEYQQLAQKDPTKEKGEVLADEEIVQLLRDVNCVVRRIVHGETARHVYFWSADNKARKDALDMAYKLRGNYAPEKKATVSVVVSEKERKRIDRILGLIDD